MKRPTFTLLLPWLLTAWTPVWSVQLGDSRASVLQELGEPAKTSVHRPDLESWTYPCGEIRLRNGAVCYILLSDEPLASSAISRPDLATQLRIAELEARLAALRVRLAQAEAEARTRQGNAAAFQAMLAPAPSRDGPSEERPWRESSPAAPAEAFPGTSSGL